MLASNSSASTRRRCPDDPLVWRVQRNGASLSLLEEYRDIAATHDRLRDLQVRLVNFAFIVAAFPFTVAGLILDRTQPLDLLTPPASIYGLALLAAVAEFSFAYSIIDARRSQYRYARTVNGIRKYFADRDSELSKYLYLPTDPAVPAMSQLGYMGGQVRLVVVIGGAFAAYTVQGVYAHFQSLFVMPPEFTRVVLAALVFAVYYALFAAVNRKHSAGFDQHLFPKLAAPTQA